MGDLSFSARLKTSFLASAGDVVFGMEDGTVSIFGLVFGVAATTADNKTVLIAGASGAVAAAVSMRAGTYLDVETARDAARALCEKLAELDTDPFERLAALVAAGVVVWNVVSTWARLGSAFACATIWSVRFPSFL